MLPDLTTAGCPCILSVRVRSAPLRTAFVVTHSAVLARVVGDYLRQTRPRLSVVWISSVAGACRRLEWQTVDLVILDSEDSFGEESIRALQAAAPQTDVLMLAGGAGGT